MRLQPPIANFDERRVNQTLHGRSVHRRENVSGHNVFRGYSNPGTGDALDLFTEGGTAVYSIAEGLVVSRHGLSDTRKEVVYLSGSVDGAPIIAVYAHVEAHPSLRVGDRLSRGDAFAAIRSDLHDPHLHFELWVGGKSVSHAMPKDLQQRMWTDYFSSAAPAPAKHWAAESMAWAKERGLIVSSRPDDPATMGHVATVLRRYHDMDREE